MGEKSATRIIPAVPRKFERWNAKPILKDPPTKVTSQVSTVSTPSVQDYGIEKHGKLPPPFYPATSSPIAPSSSSSHGSPVHFDPNRSREDQESESLPAQQLEYPQWTNLSSAYPGNPTPPDEDSSAPFHFSSDAQPFQPQPTPPSDLTPSPTQSLQKHYVYPYNISFYPPETSEFIDSPSSAQSLYHGYSYVPPPIDSNASTQLYAPLGYPTDLETFPNGLTTTSEQLASLNGSHPHEQGSDRDSPIPNDAAAPIPSNGPMDSEYHGAPPKQPVPQSPIDQAPMREVNGDQVLQDNISCFQAPNGNNSQEHTAVGYDLWRSAALDDLRTVSEDVWHEQMAMPSFFLQHFDTPRYADCRVSIKTKDQTEPALELLLHSVLLTYSPMLSLKMKSTEPASDGYRHVILDACDPFITSEAIKSALYTCYGRPLCDFVGTSVDGTAPQPHAEDSAEWMENALAFVAAGRLLGLQAVVARGLQIAIRILNRDNIEKALAFVTEPEGNIPSEMQPLFLACTRMMEDSGWTADILPPNSTAQHPYPKARLSQIKFGDLPLAEIQDTEK